MRIRRRCVALMLPLALHSLSQWALAEVITVEPGEGSLAAAVTSASAGDVLQLQPGEYDAGDLTLERGLSIRGPGAALTRITATGEVGFACLEGENTLSGFELVGRDQMRQNGVYASMSVRLEQVRFLNLNAGVRLDGAPLTDVVACEFDTCNIGVWGDNDASPMVWGSRFEKCGIGVFAVESAPYIRNNLFHSSMAGVQLFVGAPGRLPILRNNLFWLCGRNAIELHQRTDPPEAPSIRNNMFYDCKAIMLCTEPLADRFSHVFLKKVHEPLLRSRTGNEINLDYQERFIKIGEPRLTMDQDGSIEVGSIRMMRRGVATGAESESVKHWLGLEPLWMHPGVNAPIDAAPAPRFELEPGEAIVVNGAFEERLVLQMIELDPLALERRVDEERTIVEYVMPGEVEGEDAGAGAGAAVVRFDASRYLGEEDLEPQGPPWWSVRAGGDGRNPNGGPD